MVECLSSIHKDLGSTPVSYERKISVRTERKHSKLGVLKKRIYLFKMKGTSTLRERMEGQANTSSF